MRRNDFCDYEEKIKESITTSAVSLETIDNNKKYNKCKVAKQIFSSNDNEVKAKDIKNLNSYKIFSFELDKIKKLQDHSKLEGGTIRLIDQIVRNMGLEKAKGIFFSNYEFFFSHPSYRALILRNYLFIDHNKRNNLRYVNKLLQKEDNNYSQSEDIIKVRK